MKSAILQLRFILPLLAIIILPAMGNAQHCKVAIQALPNFCDPNSDVITLTVIPTTTPDPPYTYIWSTGETTQTITVPNVVGLISVTVINASGCPATAIYFIPGPLEPFAYFGHCFTCCPGDVQLLEAWWTNYVAPPNITYVWSTGETTPTIETSIPGYYSVTITDPANGCTTVVGGDVFYLEATAVEIDGPATLCSGQTATLSAIGGPFSFYEWFPTGETTSTIDVTDPGTYIVVVVEDGVFCPASDTIVIEPGSGNIPPPQLSGSAVLCSGQSGTISVINDNDYTGFNWNTGESTADISISAPGTYTVTVTDAGGCTSSASITVDPGSSNIDIAGTASPETSCTSPNGSIDISVSPSGSYSYDWSNGAGIPDITNLTAGTYTVTVTDAGGCTSSESFTVTSNIVLPGITTTPTATSCDLSNGNIDLSITPAGSYTFLWSNGATTEDLANIIAGTYTVTVTSTTNGCTANANVTVINVNPPINVSGNTSPLTSCTAPNGAIDISIAPAGTYTFLWSNGATTEDLINITSGTYTITVSSVGTCMSSSTYTVNSSVSLPMPLAAVTPATCGQNNGGLDLSVTPAGSYSFLWSNGATTEDLSAIPTGSYSVTVTDIVGGCTATITTIVPDNPIAITVSGTTLPNTSCTTSNGAIDISADPAGTYSYLWSNGATTQDINALAAGTYTVTLTLGVNCIQTASFQVLDIANPIVLSGATTPNTSCTQPNGAIDLSVVPAGAYTYLWSNGSTTEDQSQLTGGTYMVTVTASNGCTATSMFDVANTNSNYTFSGTITPNNSCVSPNGNIDLTLSPAGTYSYLWSNGSTTEDINLLPAGSYGVTVSDINSCSSVATYSVTDSIVSPSITAQLSPETCANQNGAIDLSIVPTTGNVFLWSNGSTTEDISSLPVGLYTVTVNASNGCTVLDSFTITAQNTNIILSALVSTNTQCLMPNGAIDLTVSPAGTYSFIWSNASTTEDISGVDSGSYTVTVTDAVNCSSIDTFLIQNNTTAPLLSSTITPANCGVANGAIDLMVSPAINNSFLWSNGTISEDLQNILPGTYSVIVTDTISGCTGVDTITVDNINTNFSVSAIPAPNTSCLSPTGAIDLTVTPAGAYTFLWSNGAMTEDLSNISSGSYSITITDIISCSSIETFVITDNLPVVLITPVVTSSTCGLNNGAIDLNINPSAGNIFLWSNGATSEDLLNLPSGDYIVTVTATGGCTIIDTFTVPQQGSTLTLSGITTANTNCISFNGAIDISILPAGTYAYQWSNGIPSQDQVALAPGMYTVTVSDAAGCTSSSSFTIDDQTILPTLQVTVVPATCGNSNGQIDISVSPAGSYTFDWSNAAVTEDLLAVSPGMYSVTVTGINGCASDTLVEVMNTGLSFSVSGTTTDHTTCNTWNGAIEITIAPAGSYTFLWSDGKTIEDLTALEPGTYAVTITDLSGCSTSAQYTIDNNVIPIMVDHLITPVLCGEPNGAIDLTITPSTGNTFIWSNGNTTEDLDNIMTGHYEVTITTQNGCNTSSAFDVPGSEGVQITLQTNTTSAGSNLITITAQLNVTPAVIDTIIWLPEQLFNCNSALCLEQTITRPDTKTEIKVIAIDTNGCLAQELLLIDAINDPLVYIPNVFSPNGDGINDVFTIYGNKDVDLIVEMQIFDRWGNQVFINREFPPNEINFGWDGTFKNQYMNPAVFAYWARVRYKDGTEAPHKGDVTIVR